MAFCGQIASAVKLTNILFIYTLITTIHAQDYSWDMYGGQNHAFASHVQVEPIFGTCGHPDWANNTYFNSSYSNVSTCAWQCEPERNYLNRFAYKQKHNFIVVGDIGLFWSDDCIHRNVSIEPTLGPQARKKRQVSSDRPDCVQLRIINESGFLRETHTMKIKPADSNLKQGVIFDTFVVGSDYQDGPALRITGDTLKLSSHGNTKTYERSIESEVWTDVAIQVTDETSDLFLNGDYMSPTAVHDEPIMTETRKKRRAGSRHNERHISFGIASHENIYSGLSRSYQLELLMAPTCRSIGYGGVVNITDLNGTQQEVDQSVFAARGTDTSIYNCDYNEERVTLFACAYLLEPVEAIDAFNVRSIRLCREFCQEIVGACGVSLHSVPHIGNVDCSLFSYRSPRTNNCVNNDYLPYSGIYKGEIQDYGYYDEALTNREIKALTSTFPDVEPLSDCLCEPNYPVISHQNNNYCLKNLANDDNMNLNALHRTESSEIRSRYAAQDLHLPQFTVDYPSDGVTSWVSSPGLAPVALVYLFPQDLQVMGITLTLHLASLFPEINDLSPNGTVYAMEIALLNGDTWRTVHYWDTSCTSAGSRSAPLEPAEVVCTSPQVLITRQQTYVSTLDLIEGRDAYYNATHAHIQLVSFLNGKGVRIKFNGFPRYQLNERNTVQMAHFVNNVDIWARMYEGRIACGCYEQGTDPAGDCDTETGQCPCRSDIGNPDKAGLKCEPYVSRMIPPSRPRSEQRCSDVGPRPMVCGAGYGPVAGKTKLIIKGGYFGNFTSLQAASNHIHITFGDTGLVCEDLNANQTHIVCYTQALNISLPGLIDYLNQPLQVRIQLFVNNNTFSITDEGLRFTYKSDPVITDVQPLASFLKGGSIQTVIGQDFYSVFAPLMEVTVVYDDGRQVTRESVSEVCDVKSNTIMWCPAPEIPPDTRYPWNNGRRRRETNGQAVSLGEYTGQEIGPVTVIKGRHRRNNINIINRPHIRFYIGFKLDGVPTYKNATEALGEEKGEIDVYPNPTIVPWDPDTLIFRPYDGDEFIDVSGNHLNLGAQLSDYFIKIGSAAECTAEELNTNKIYCKPPKKAPRHGKFSKSGAHRVILTVGNGNLKYHVGYLRYYETLWDDPKVRAAVISVVVIVGIILLAVLIVCLVLKRLYGDPIAHIRGRLRYTPTPTDTNSYEQRPRLLMDMLDPELKEKISECLIEPHTRMRLGHEVGKGNFGKVYSGLLAFPGQTEPTDCAIKTLKEDSKDVKELAEFLEEATIMKDFKHPNVLSLYGVVIVQNKPHVLLPFMVYGDLRGYVGNSRNSFSVGELLDYGLQVSQGMAYLAKLKFVHRDLAARNCMVDEKKVIKIADFGLARDIYEKDYYAVEDKRRPMPIKWMAPECLDTFKFDSRSDVWSYAVTLWEVLMRGRKPYAGVDNLDMKRYLQRGSRLEKPAFCPDTVFELMLACWHYDPAERPVFKQITEQLQEILDEAKQAESAVPQQAQATNQHDYLEMVRMSQPGYVPLETDVPADRIAASSTRNNGIESKPPSERYTREPERPRTDYNDPYLKPFTNLPDDQKVKDDVEGYEGVRRPSQDQSRYQGLESESRESDMPREQAPGAPRSPDAYLAPVSVGVSRSPQGADGYLPPAQVSVHIDDATAQYSNL